MLSTVWKYSSLFDEKSILSFTKWCSHKKLDFMKVTPKRRLTKDGERLNIRTLFVLKKQFIDSTVENITKYLPAYQKLIQNLKEEGYTVIGYVRKSPTAKDDTNRTTLLKAMCNRLKERSAVDYIFVSVCSKASDPFNERDKDKDSELLVNLNAIGDTQDMLQFIVDKPKVCLVALDHAGLTTNTNDLRQFLRQNQQVKKIIIDRLPHSNEIIKYDSTQLLHNQTKLEEFDCRRPSYKRSI
ncbi:hypothetical protein G6F42_011335 [Rhizopus arrhizus]|nr:hypothetical protein G6F42_011335 [Rhizopus arrhizus]